MLIYTLIKYSPSKKSVSSKDSDWIEIASGNETNSNTSKLAMLALYKAYRFLPGQVLLKEYNSDNDLSKFITDN